MTLEYGPIQRIFNSQISILGGHICLCIGRFGPIELTSQFFIYNIVNIQSFGIGLLDIDDHRIDHPIITTNKRDARLSFNALVRNIAKK
jgi:hypothetical protein